MEGNEVVGETVMKLLDTLDRDDAEKLNGFKIVECGIVVILESEDLTTCRTRTSADRHYVKRGIWEQALDTVKHGITVDEP